MLLINSKQFNSNIKYLLQFATDIDNSFIKNEPMFFNCDLEFAYDNGGPITKSFIDALPDDWRGGRAVFDSRVHMLMPGWYPAIPGYHHDDVPRTKEKDGQPDYDNQYYKSEHILGLVNADICPTHFALGYCVMPAVPKGDIIYRVWHDEIVRLIENGVLKEIKAKDRQLIYFDCDTFHTAEKAISNGWRWFGRVSRNTDRVNNITNEIRRQVQVYLEFPTNGW